MSYKHGDDCSWHWFLFIFSLEVLSDLRPFSLRVCLIFFFFLRHLLREVGIEGENGWRAWLLAYRDGGNGREAAKGPDLLPGMGLCSSPGSCQLLSPSSCLLHIQVLSTTSLQRVPWVSSKGPPETGICCPACRMPKGRSWEVLLLQELGGTCSPACSRLCGMAGMVWHPSERALMEGWSSESRFDLWGVCVVRRQRKKCCCWGWFML